VDKISVEAPYLTVKDQRSLSGTRCSAAVASTYAVMMHLGMKGYANVVQDCMENTEYLAEGIRKAGGELVIEPPMNIIAFRTGDNKRTVSDMSERGWCLSRTKHPDAVRMVIMPHIRREHAETLLSDLEEVLQDL
jgi:tyrosine decarboxylase/aspartate 1-decarboxylase